MCFGKALYELIAFSMNCFYTKKILNYGFKEQILSLFPILVSSTIMFIAILLINNLFSSYWMMILIGIIGGFCIYIGLSACFKEEALASYYRMIRNFSFSKVYNRRKKDVNTK